MNINDLVALINAGYTKADIEQLGISMEKEKPQEEKPKEEKPQEEKPKEEKPQEEKPKDGDERFTKIETQLNYLVNRLNLLAVQNSNQPKQEEETVEDILNSMFKPKMKGDN